MYTYEKLADLFSRKKKNLDFHRLSWKLKLYKEEEVFKLFMHGHHIADVHPDNRMQLWTRGWEQSITTRLTLTGICGMYIYSHMRERVQQNVRCGHRVDGRWVDMPFMEGMWAKDSMPMHPEQHVDCIRQFKPGVRLPLQREMRPLMKLVRVMARLDTTGLVDKGYISGRAYEDLEPTVANAECILFNYGYSKRHRYWRGKPQLDADLAVRKFTEKVYRHREVYEFVPKQEAASK